MYITTCIAQYWLKIITVEKCRHMCRAELKCGAFFMWPTLVPEWLKMCWKPNGCDFSFDIDLACISVVRGLQLMLPLANMVYILQLPVSSPPPPPPSSSSSSSSSSILQPWVGLGLLKQMSPASSILGIRPPNFYNPVSLLLPLPRQSILISVIAVSLVI